MNMDIKDSIIQNQLLYPYSIWNSIRGRNKACFVLSTKFSFRSTFISILRQKGIFIASLCCHFHLNSLPFELRACINARWFSITETGIGTKHCGKRGKTEWYVSQTIVYLTSNVQNKSIDLNSIMMEFLKLLFKSVWNINLD